MHVSVFQLYVFLNSGCARIRRAMYADYAHLGRMDSRWCLSAYVNPCGTNGRARQALGLRIHGFAHEVTGIGVEGA